MLNKSMRLLTNEEIDFVCGSEAQTVARVISDTSTGIAQGAAAVAGVAALTPGGQPVAFVSGGVAIGAGIDSWAFGAIDTYYCGNGGRGALCDKVPMNFGGGSSNNSSGGSGRIDMSKFNEKRPKPTSNSGKNS
ncbi:hypothetical protein ACUHMQ_12900 [Chitinimonas sp. PSY-7]|uniref:hypothetical protein n=1 Tax=Chitinimonas sp. PSY-7 TaxID=3459088 RepID=UPI0040402869